MCSHGMYFWPVSPRKFATSFELAIDARSPEAAEASAREMCDRLLANPVTEDYTLVVED